MNEMNALLKPSSLGKCIVQKSAFHTGLYKYHSNHACLNQSLILVFINHHVNFLKKIILFQCQDEIL